MSEARNRALIAAPPSTSSPASRKTTTENSTVKTDIDPRSRPPPAPDRDHRESRDG
ncbi:hypothetical protein Pta02_55430 [Planobispora takensis]|uniref:Uncharacterized protein n=1 Tax=Planobispora takensis TaxID=1367882 RepID=A0A8J3WVX8_9ACTN|nr:hypothetical protein Pta02_55430 [Planobispora takensis]